MGNFIVSGLLFADNLLVCSPSAGGLRRLLRICHCHASALKLTISLKKSKVISCVKNTWDVTNKDEEVYECFGKGLVYKYLGVEVYNTMFQTSTAKQLKAVGAARRYRAATRYLSRQGPDTVDVSVCSLRNVA